MNIPEIDNLLNWFRSNVFDVPNEKGGVELKSSENRSNAVKNIPFEGANLYPSRSDLEDITEYDFPLSLLENILGIEHY